MHTSLIAQELRNQGFIVKVYKQGILVSLSRFVYISELETVLDYIFEGVVFNLSRYNNSVLVKE